MSSQSSAYNSSYAGSSDYPIVRQDTFRSQKSKDHKGDITERQSHGSHSVIYNYHARGYEQDAPTPTYSQSSYKRHT
ncbi:hypothetical protein ANO14919_106940 [Xylariales sp. No.14919]|nr:hypothetical protein F5X98DRAFT_370484 [Xylaria grammica]GAW21176.1 hypothetical protein ANO14919_106940 [Xylariales sp. No.14919]